MIRFLLQFVLPLVLFATGWWGRAKYELARQRRFLRRINRIRDYRHTSSKDAPPMHSNSRCQVLPFNDERADTAEESTRRVSALTDALAGEGPKAGPGAAARAFAMIGFRWGGRA